MPIISDDSEKPAPNSNQLNLSISGGRIVYYNASAGNELAAYEGFAPAVSEGLEVYKALGDVDVVTFEDTTFTLKQDFNGNSYPYGKVGYTGETKLIKWRVGGDEYSPDIIPWLKDTKVIGLVVLTVNKAIKGIAISEILDFLANHLSISNSDIAIYGGFGHSEICLLAKPESLLQLSQVITEIRSSTPAKISKAVKVEHGSTGNTQLFSHTKTFPLISYRNVIGKPAGLQLLTEKIMAEVHVKCPPGQEGKVRDSISNENIGLESCFGSSDLRLYTMNPITLGDLLKDIFALRDKFQKFDYGSFYSETFISIIGDKVEDTDSILADQPIRTRDLIPSGLTEKNPLLNAACDRYYSYFDSLIINKDLQYSLNDMFGIGKRIGNELSEYVKNVDKLSSGKLEKKQFNIAKASLDHEIQNTIFQWIDNSYKGIAQRINLSAGLYRSGVQHFRLLSGFDGYHSTIIAINGFPNSLYKTFFQHFPFDAGGSFTDYDEHEETSWLGFVYFEEAQGFRLKAGHVYTLPDSAAHQPFSKNINWLTLSHEFSHDVWTRFNIEKTIRGHEAVFLQGIGITAQDDEKSYDSKYAYNLYFELFATYFDYYHFYAEDMDFFQKNVWSCWLRVPIVQDDQSDYISRSFIVYAMKDLKGFSAHYVMNKDKAFLRRKWKDYKDYISTLMGGRIELERYEEKVLAIALAVAGPFSTIFNGNLINEDFKNALNQEYDGWEGHVSDILEGRVVHSGMKNIYLILKKCVEQCNYGNDDDFSNNEYWRASATFIMSLREVGKVSEI